MGVFKVFGHFALTLFSAFLWVFLLVNLISYANLDFFDSVLSSNGYTKLDFDESFFGFSSFMNALNDMPSPNLTNTFYWCFKHIAIDGIYGNIDWSWLQEYSDIAYNILSGLVRVLDTILTPFRFLVTIFGSIGALIVDFFQYFIWICKIFGGLYNLPVTTPVVS